MPVLSGRLLNAISQLLIAALTFPAGMLGSLAVIGLVLSGVATPEEAILLAIPVYAVAGYLQWFRLFPALYSRRV